MTLAEPMIDPAYETLKREHEDLLQFLYLSPIGVIQSDGEGTISIMNPVAVQTIVPVCLDFGVSNLREVFSQVCPALNDQIDAYEHESGMICNKYRFRVPPEGDAAQIRFIEVSITKLSPDQYMTVVADVTDAVRLQDDAHRQDERMRAVFDTVRDYAIYTLDCDGRIDSWNKSGERMLGLDKSTAIGLDFQTLLDDFNTVRHDGAALLDEARRHGWVEFDGWSSRSPGSDYWCDCMITVLSNKSGAFDGYSVVARDNTDRRNYEHRLRRMAETDPLTGVCNHRSFMEHVQEAINHADETGTELGFAMVDIDHFKKLNDTYGHQAGDEALKHFTTVMQGALRQSDVIGRLGGEEFGILLRGAKKDLTGALLERLCTLVQNQSIEVGDQCIRFTCSIGLAFLGDGDDNLPATLIARADAALYDAKEAGRNRVIAAE